MAATVNAQSSQPCRGDDARTHRGVWKVVQIVGETRPTKRCRAATLAPGAVSDAPRRSYHGRLSLQAG